VIRSHRSTGDPTGTSRRTASRGSTTAAPMSARHRPIASSS
jgi:hypothetical protein